MEKKCTKCGEVKTLDEFHNSIKKKNGKRNECKCCRTLYDKKIYEKKKNPDISRLQLIKLHNQNNGLKKCTNCAEVKSLDDFYNDKKRKDGKQCNCKICNKEYTNKNRQKIKENRKYYYELNKEIFKKRQKEYKNKNKEYVKKKQREYYLINGVELYKKQKQYRNQNKEKINKKQKEYQNQNRENINKYRRIKYNTDPLFKLRSNITSSISDSLKSKGYTKKNNTHIILKCKFDFFINWLNNVASNGYTYGIGNLHLDHVVPISLAKTEQEIIILNHYTNFQLLTSEDNISKGNRYVNPTNLKRVLEHHPNPEKIKEIHARL